MAATQNTPNITLPQRSITITGPMTARMFQASVRASRLDLRATQVALAHPSVRDPSNRAIKRFEEALARFETEIGLVEKDLDDASRTTDRRNGQQKQNPKSRKPERDGRTEAAGAASVGPESAKAGKPSATGGNQTQGAAGQGTKSGTRNKNKGNGESAPKPSQQQPASVSAQAASPAPAQPVVAPSGPSAPVQPQPAPKADVPADIEAL